MSIWQRARKNSGAEPETGVRAAWGHLTGSAEFLHKEAEKELTGHTYVVVSKNRTDEVREALHLLSGAQNQVLWVIPYLPGEEVPSEQNRAYTAIGWEVKPWK